MGEDPAWRFRRAGAAPADAGRARLRGRLRPGGAASARIARRVAGGDGRARRGADRGGPGRGAEDRQRADLGSVRAAELYDPVQRGGVSRDLDLLRLWRGRLAGRNPAGRQAVPGTGIVPGGGRVREGDCASQYAPGAGRLSRAAQETASEMRTRLHAAAGWIAALAVMTPPQT